METFRKVKIDQTRTDPELCKRSFHNFADEGFKYILEKVIDNSLLQRNFRHSVNSEYENGSWKKIKPQNVNHSSVANQSENVCGNCKCPRTGSSLSNSHLKNQNTKNFDDKNGAVEFNSIDRESNLASTYSEGNSDQEGSSLKRVKRESYGIHKTVDFNYTGKEGREVSTTDSDQTIKGESKFLNIINVDKYEIHKYHIMTHQRVSNSGGSGMFSPVYDILKGLFKNSICVDDIKGLSSKSFLIFSVIVEKKFRIKITDQDDNSVISQLVNVIKGRSVEKRPEECKKIVLSYTIKQLKNSLKNHYAQQYRKNTFEEFFYQYYFEHVSTSESIPLEDFYYPIASVKCKKNSSKTINKTYINNIKKSEKFMVAANKYIETDFLKDYTKEIDNKLLDLINRWESEFKKMASLDVFKSSIAEYFKDDKSKMPWTNSEIQYAIGKVRKIIS